MTCRRPPHRRLALVLLIAGAVSPSPASTRSSSAGSTPRLESPRFVDTNFPEVRIRKLHLVRPDLIPYPLVHDVFC